MQILERSIASDFSLEPGRAHEFHAASGADGTGLAGCVMALAHRGERPPKLWVRHSALDRELGALSAVGLAEFGLDPAQVILVSAGDVLSVLQAGLEGARCLALGAVILEFLGEASVYDLTASRRLALAARASGVTVFVVRIAARPAPGAVETRWLVRPVLSQALAVNAPGNPAFEMTLLRARSGQDGLRYLVEWNRDARKLVTRSLATTPDHADADGRASLHGAVVPVSFDRPGPLSQGGLPRRHAG